MVGSGSAGLFLGDFRFERAGGKSVSEGRSVASESALDSVEGDLTVSESRESGDSSRFSGSGVLREILGSSAISAVSLEPPMSMVSGCSLRPAGSRMTSPSRLP